MSIYLEISLFEKEQAKRRRANVNPSVSEQMRLALAKEPFKDDVMNRLIMYHNTYVEMPAQTEQSLSYTKEMDEYLTQRVDQLNQAISNKEYFRNFMFNTASKSLRVEVQPQQPYGVFPSRQQ
jgi:hypothetical protein